MPPLLTVQRSQTKSAPAQQRSDSPTLRLAARVSVIVINYLRWADTVSLVRGLRQSELLRQGAAEIFVIDNHSPFDKLTRLLGRWDGVTLKRWRRNRGFSRAVNAAAALSQGEWLLLLNPDMSVTEGFLDQALALADQAAAADPSLGILGFRILDTDGSPQGSVGPFPTLLGTLARMLRPRARRKYMPSPSERARVPWLSGCCLMIRRDCFRQLGGCDENFFLYYEDVDLCRRAREHGWSVWFEPSLSIVHHRPLHSRVPSAAMRVMTRQSLLIYASRHWPRWQTRMLSWIVRLEAWCRRTWASWQGNEAASRRFELLRRLARLMAQGRDGDARRLLRKMIHEEEERGADALS